MNQRRLLIVEQDRELRDLLTGALGVTFAVQAVSCDPDRVASSVEGFRPRAVLMGSGADREAELRTLIQLRRAAPAVPVTLFGQRYLPGAPLVRRAMSLGGVTRAPWPRDGHAPEQLATYVERSLLPWFERADPERGSRRRYSEERLGTAEEAWLRELVREHTGQEFAGVGVQLQIRLLRLLQAYAYDSLTELVAEVRAADFGPMHEEILDRLTELPTGFFRPAQLYECLRARLLPELVTARSAERRLAVWSMECGLGQSAYSLAFLLHDLPGLEGWEVHHLATDASADRVQRTRAGTYDALDLARGLRPSDQARFGPVAGGFQVRHELRRELDCRVLGLREPWPALPGFDLISVARPLSSYVPAAREVLLRRLSEHLRPGGMLLLDQGDGVWGRQHGFRPERAGQATVHRLAA